MYIFNETGPSFGCVVAWQTAEGTGAAAVDATAVESLLVFNYTRTLDFLSVRTVAINQSNQSKSSALPCVLQDHAK